MYLQDGSTFPLQTSFVRDLKEFLLDRKKIRLNTGNIRLAIILDERKSESIMDGGARR